MSIFTKYSPNRRAATEALYHILQSGHYNLLPDLPSNMTSGGSLIDRTDEIARQLHRKGYDEPLKRILEFLIAYDPRDHKSHRFLGETLSG